jgi:quercetin dioxygenase-like cupin family protein
VTPMRRTLCVAVLGLLTATASSQAADLDRTAVDFTIPSEIKWVRNAAGTSEQAVLFGDPSKPGPYVVRIKWLPGNMSRPHSHPNDRFFAVLSGTWWVGTGEKFDPEATVPVPAGSYVIHYGGKVHYDGAKGEETIIQLWGMGPATATPFDKR